MSRSNVESKGGSRFTMVATIGIVIAALYFGREIFLPLAVAALIVFVLAPLVGLLERWRLNRGVATVLVVGLAMAVVAGLGYVVVRQFAAVVAELPQYREDIQAKFAHFRKSVSPLKRMTGEVEKVVSTGATASTQASAAAAHATGTGESAASGVAGEKPAPLLPGSSWKQPDHAAPTTAPSPDNPLPVTIISQRSSSYKMAEDWAGNILGPLATAGIVIGFVIFILIAREDLRDRVIRLFGHGRLNLTTQAIDEATSRITRYLVAQSLVNAGYGIAVAGSLWLIGRVFGRDDPSHGFPNVLLWALLCTLLRFIPYVGVWVAMVLPLAVSFALFKSNLVFISTLTLFMVLEVVVGQFVEPYFYGASTGMSALAVLLAAVFWTALWGPLGLLLSTPLTVCLVVLGKYVPQLAFLDILLGDEPVLQPPVRVYQRLIALDQEEAADLVRGYLKEKSVEQVYDQVLLPALGMAERDHHRGELDEERHRFFRQGVRDLIEEIGDLETARLGQQASAAVVRQAKEQVTDSTAEIQRFKVPHDCKVNVLCLPARDEADELAAMMLAQLLNFRGYCAESVGPDVLAGEMVELAESKKADIICLSALPPAAVAHARYLFKRVTARLPEARLVIGLWTSGGDLERARERITGIEPANLITTLAEAQALIDQMTQHVVVADTTATPAESDPRLAPA